jgi:hypothetical protein
VIVKVNGLPCDHCGGSVRHVPACRGVMAADKVYDELRSQVDAARKTLLACNCPWVEPDGTEEVCHECMAALAIEKRCKKLLLSRYGDDRTY